MLRTYLLLALIIAFSMNTLALYAIIKILKKYSAVRDSSKVERSVKKAYVSRKKKDIAVTQIKKMRSTIFRVSFYQFLIPISAFIASIILYVFTTLPISIINQNPFTIHLSNPCIAPIPIQFPENNGKTCSMQVSWIFFLVFILYLPLYTYYTRKYLD